MNPQDNIRSVTLDDEYYPSNPPLYWAIMTDDHGNVSKQTMTRQQIIDQNYVHKLSDVDVARLWGLNLESRAGQKKLEQIRHQYPRRIDYNKLFIETEVNFPRKAFDINRDGVTNDVVLNKLTITLNSLPDWRFRFDDLHQKIDGYFLDNHFEGLAQIKIYKKPTGYALEVMAEYGDNEPSLALKNKLQTVFDKDYTPKPRRSFLPPPVPNTLDHLRKVYTHEESLQIIDDVCSYSTSDPVQGAKAILSMSLPDSDFLNNPSCFNEEIMERIIKALEPLVLSDDYEAIEHRTVGIALKSCLNLAQEDEYRTAIAASPTLVDAIQFYADIHPTWTTGQIKNTASELKKLCLDAYPSAKAST